MYLEIFLADFAVFRENTWISRVCDRAKYQMPCQVFTLQRRFIFSGFHRIIELKTSKHEFADIIQKNKRGFEGKKLSEGQAGRNALRFNTTCAADLDESAIGTQDSNCFLTSISCLFCLLSSRILQNNVLDLYLIEIRRYKLSFFAKEATYSRQVNLPSR